HVTGETREARQDSDRRAGDHVVGEVEACGRPARNRCLTRELSLQPRHRSTVLLQLRQYFFPRPTHPLSCRIAMPVPAPWKADRDSRLAVLLPECGKHLASALQS